MVNVSYSKFLFDLELWTGCKLATFMPLLIQGYILLKHRFVLSPNETLNRYSTLAPNLVYLLANSINICSKPRNFD